MSFELACISSYPQWRWAGDAVESTEGVGGQQMLYIQKILGKKISSGRYMKGPG